MAKNGEQTSITVTISPRTIALVLVVVLVVWLATRLTNLLLVIFTAILLAAAVDQPASWLERHGLKRPFAVLLIYLALVILLGGLVAASIPLISTEIGDVKDQLPTYANEVQHLIERLTPGRRPAPTFSFEKITTTLSANLDTVATRLTTITLRVGQTLVLILAIFVIAYFLAVDPTLETKLLARFLRPEVHTRATQVAHSIRKRIGDWARGQFLIAILFGIAMGVGLRLIGIPFALSLGFIAAVLEVIPYVGGFVTIVLAALVALPLGWGHIVAAIALYFILVLIEAHILTPILMGHLVGMPTVAILIALLAGAELVGIVGALLAVPGAIIVWAIVEEIWPNPTHHERTIRLGPIRERVDRRNHLSGVFRLPSGQGAGKRAKNADKPE
ncbi:MAG TPA: AI-2E family transporter [Thermomicrobiales bacterium]|nr:AI-2E family transporter [Thermomicrobiales bacterium]